MPTFTIEKNATVDFRLTTEPVGDEAKKAFQDFRCKLIGNFQTNLAAKHWLSSVLATQVDKKYGKS